MTVRQNIAHKLDAWVQLDASDRMLLAYHNYFADQILALIKKEEKMEAKQPTREQIKEFWKWCGFKITPIDGYGKEYLGSFYRYPDGSRVERYVDIDLNNLFQYAVPIAINKIAERQECSKELAKQILFKKWLQKIEDGLTEEDALFWAIWEVIHA